MPQVQYSQRSPYSQTGQNSWCLGYYVHRSVPPNANDTLIVIDQKYHERPDLLSYSLYGTVEYWWVFTARNMDIISDPIFGLKAGMSIYVPSVDFLASCV